MLELLGALFASGRTGVLILLLVGAAVIDYRSHRIPNWLVLFGTLYGLIYNALLPTWPQGSIFIALAGVGLGLLLFLPLYLIRVMGAGDVKLLAMAGAFLGVDDIMRAALASMLVGGALAILFVLMRGKAMQIMQNMMCIFRVGIIDAMNGSTPSLRITAGASVGKLPYGVAIALGTTGYLTLRQLAFL
jgi:prepilin peptidase CpaA